MGDAALPMRELKYKERPGFDTRTMRWLYRVLYPFFHCRVNLPAELRDSEEPVVFIGNHYNVFGPVSFILSMPVVARAWINVELVQEDTAGEALHSGMAKLLPFLGEKPRNWLCARIAHMGCGTLARLGVIPVDRNRPSTLISTMRQSLQALQEGQNLVIFPEVGLPEYSLTSVTPFFSGFAMLGQLYHRKTGKALRFCPCYIDEQHRRICIGEPVAWDPEKEPKEETERVSEELNRRIRETADLNRGVRKEPENPARRILLLVCNLIRLGLLIPLSGILRGTDPGMILPLYCASQGIRILFNFAAHTYASTSRLSFLLSQGIGILTDLCLLAGPVSGTPLLRWLLYALAVNGAVILISNLAAAARYRRCAGPNFYDYLSADLRCAVLLLQLLKVPLPAPVLWIAVAAAMICLVFSAGFSLAFNGRISLEKAEEAPAE